MQKAQGPGVLEHAVEKIRDDREAQTQPREPSEHSIGTFYKHVGRKAKFSMQ